MPSKSPVTRSPDRDSKNPAGGFGLLFLLLAAVPFDQKGYSALNPNPECNPNSRPNLATMAHLRYCASLSDEVKRAADQLRDESVEEEKKKGRKAIKAKAPASDSDSDAGVTVGSSYESEQLSNSFTSVELHNTHLRAAMYDLGDDLMAHVASYLTVRDVALCRSVSSMMFRACEAVMPSPLQGSIFLRFEQETFRGRKFDVPPQRNLLRWICGYCSTTNNVGTPQCRQCCGSCHEGHGIRRVFFGQLRKERTTELVEWIIASTCPQVEVFHIENHTNGPDGRGKGCAWVYVTNPADEARLLALNKRMFVDIDDDRREGVWFCDPEHTEQLGNMAGARAYKPNRPIVLARQPLVVERPQMKVQAQSPPKEASSKRWTRVPKGRTAQELYEESSVATIPAGYSPADNATHRIRVGYPLPHHLQQPTRDALYGGCYNYQYGSSGLRMVSDTHYVHDPYGVPTLAY